MRGPDALSDSRRSDIGEGDQQCTRAGAAVNCRKLAQKTDTLVSQLLYSIIDGADRFSGMRALGAWCVFCKKASALLL